MTTSLQLRHQAQSWRAAAERTRAEEVQLIAATQLRWRSPAAHVFQRNVERSRRELRILAQREDELARLLDRIAADWDRGAA